MPILGGLQTAALTPTLINPVTPPDVNDIYVPSSGAWLGNSPGARPLSDHEADLGRTVDIAHVYRNFAHYDTPAENFPGTTQQGYIDGGRMLLWNLKPADTTWTAINAGSQDARIDAIADNIVEWEGSHPGVKTFMAFHHEPEDDCTEGGGSFGTAAAYANAYKRVRDRFTARGVTSVIYMWIMTGYKTRVNLWNTLYPGDDYADWLGYEPYPIICPAFCAGGTNDPFFEAFGEYPAQAGTDDTGKYRFYKWATGVGAVDIDDAQTYTKSGVTDKPIMIGEWSPSDHPTSPTGAMASIFNDWGTAVTENRYPQIRAFVYWESGESACCTHRINSSASNLSAYVAVTSLSQLNRPRPY